MVILNIIKLGWVSLIGETRNSTHHFSSKKWGGGPMFTSKVASNLTFFQKTCIYFERGKFAASFYNKTHFWCFFPNGRFLEGGLKGNSIFSFIFSSFWINICLRKNKRWEKATSDALWSATIKINVSSWCLFYIK